MIQEYVNKLIDNLPIDIKNTKSPIILDIVLEGGVFNGSYLVGAMHFLKEMEKRNYIKVERISGCSIGSIVGFLYFINKLELMPELYSLVQTDFNKYYNLKILKSSTVICRKNCQTWMIISKIRQKKEEIKLLMFVLCMKYTKLYEQTTLISSI
jgi:predicted acylesterase/phospholipase RssA